MFLAWMITSDNLPEKVPCYTTNAEPDYRIWRHATQTSANKNPDLFTRHECLQHWIKPANINYVIQHNVYHAVDKNI